MFNGCDNGISAKILSKAQKQSVRHIHFDQLSLFNGLHCASIFVIDEIVVSSVEVEGCGIKQRDGMSLTALAWAAGIGHEGVVRVLLSLDDIDPGNPGEDGQTPLCLAAYKGREEVVKMLPGRSDVDPDKPGKDGETPLLQAAYNGCEGVVKILLGRVDVNPNKSDERGETPLLWAAHYEHEVFVPNESTMWAETRR